MKVPHALIGYLAAFVLLSSSAYSGTLFSTNRGSEKHYHCISVKCKKNDPQELQRYLLEKAVAAHPERIFEYHFTILTLPVKIQIVKNIISFYGDHDLLQAIADNPAAEKIVENPEHYHFIKREDFEHVGVHKGIDETDISHWHVAHLDAETITTKELASFVEFLRHYGDMQEEDAHTIVKQFRDFSSPQSRLKRALALDSTTPKGSEQLPAA
jgi:hypothetical protein